MSRTYSNGGEHHHWHIHFHEYRFDDVGCRSSAGTSEAVQKLQKLAHDGQQVGMLVECNLSITLGDACRAGFNIFRINPEICL